MPLRAALRPDTWSHVVATWQGWETHVSVDGVPADTVTDASRGSVKRAPVALEVRGVAHATDIRELRVYRHALSPRRVREHFVAGRPVFGRAAPHAGRSVAHAADALTASVRPSVSGTTTDGQTLSATTGTWDGTAPIDYVRQWERCDTDGEDCTDIDGADGASYDLTELDVGATLRVRVTATDATSATGAATSDQTAVVAPSPPATATLPAVTGDPVEGLTLDADLGPWTGTPPITFSTEWLRCTAGGTGCEYFANPGGAHYVVKHSDIGSTFRIRVSAWSAGGYAIKTSRATAVVTSAEAPDATAELPELDGTEVDDHERIAATTIGTFTGSVPMTFAHRWEYCEDDRTPRCQQVSGGDWSSSGTDAESGTVDAAYGTSVRLVVTATNIAGSAQMISAEVPIIPVAITLADELDLSGQWVGGTVNAEKFVAGAHIYGGAAYPTNDASYPLTSTGAVLRCDDTTIGSCSPISGTSSDDLGGLSYTVTAGDIGHYLRIRKTVTNAAGSETAYTRAQLVDHSAPMWIGSNDAPATDGYTPVSGGLALSKGDGNDDDGLQVFDTVRWTPGQWIGDDMEDDSGVLVSWRRSDGGLSLGSGRTWTIDTKEWDEGDSLAVREYATNTYGSGLHIEDTGRQTVRSSPVTPVSLTPPTMLAASVPKEGDILDGVEGTWEDGHEDPDSVIRTLLRCDASGDDCEVINQPRLGSEAVGHRYKWRETASNGAGSVTVESPLTKHPAWVSNYRRALWEDQPWWAFPEYSPDWIWQLGGGHEDSMGIDLGMSGRGAAFDRADGWSLEAIVTSATLPTLGGASDHEDPMILYVGRDDLTAFADPSHATAHPGRGYGFGLRDDGCLYGSFGFRREFSLGSCVSSLGITSPQHFVMTYDYSDVRFYVDGTLTATVAMTDPFPTELLPGSPFEYGVVSRGYRPRRNNTPTATSETTNILSGSIPQAATYQGVLTADRIAAHGTAVADDTSLAQLVNTVAPAISGTAREGRLLTASAGTWTGATPIERAYQWKRCAANGTACADIDEATETSYRATDADVGHTLRVVVEATNEVGADSVTSTATAEIETGPPVVTVDPVIIGDALDQHELTADDGTWAGTGPQTTARQWRRCDAAGAACADIAGADGVHYTVEPADVGGTLRLAVTATSTEGSTTATTDATEVVAVSAPEAAEGPSITGTAKVGETLDGHDGTWRATAPLTLTRQWLRCDDAGEDCDEISGETGTSYDIVEGDRGHVLRLRVHAANAIGSDTVVSPVGDAVVMAPTATDAPTLSGTAVDGTRLTVDGGTWRGSEPIEVAVRWQRCDAVGAGCADIDGATADTFDLTGDDIGHQLLVIVTASGPGGTTTVELPTDEVAAAPPVNVRAPTIGGIAQPDGQLVVHPGRWTGTNPITYTYAWSSCDEHGEDCEPVDGATAATFDVTEADRGHTLRATVTATNVRDDESVTTAPSKVVGAFSATIDGLPLIGQSIAAIPSEIVGAHPVFTYQWQRCDGVGAACTDLEGQAGDRYEVTAGDDGHTFRVSIHAEAGAHSATALSSATDPASAPAPVNHIPPIVDGRLAVGGTVGAINDTWDPAGPKSYSWSRCDAEGTDCSPISGATGQTYVLQNDDAGFSLIVTVTETTAGGATTVASRPSAVVPEATVHATAPPTVTLGAGPSGDRLTAAPGTWTGDGTITYTYTWQSCDAAGAHCAPIQDADGDSYPVGDGDVGTTLRAVVTGDDGHGSVAVRSAASPLITAAAPASDHTPMIAGAAAVGALLTVDESAWTGTGPVVVSYQWQRCASGGGDCEDIDDATSEDYTPDESDLGHPLRVVLDASGPHGTASATTAITDDVDVAAAEDGPEVSVDPVITGSTVAGSTLTADHGTWTGDGPLTYAVKWEACDTGVAHCSEVAEGAETYVTTMDDVGSIIRAIVTVTDVNGQTNLAWARTAQPIRAVDGPVADPLPVISGTAREGQLLSTTTGSWTGSGTLTYDYQWQRCDTLADLCSDIDGATAATYEAVADDIDSALRVAVTAEDENEVATVALSALTDTIAPAVPLARTEPTITGATETGSTLHAATGSWDGVASITYTYQWRSCDLTGADCADISGATDDDYLLVEGDAGSTLRVTVTATNGDGSASKSSDATATVATAGGPEAAAPPTISGTEQEGSVLTAVPGSWTGDGTITYTYQWLLCDDGGAGCALVAGASDVDFTPTVDETFAILRVAVTAHDSAGSRTVLSDPTGVIAPAPANGALANTVAPTISGDTADGSVLSAAHGTWTGGDAVTFAYRWRRCDADGRGCIPIDGAADADLQLSSDDIGHRLRVSVTARSGTDSLTVLSAATDVVTRGLPEPPDELNVDGDAIEGSTVSVDDGGWTGTDLEMTHQWQRCASDTTGCVDIDGATEASYLLVPDDVGHVLRAVVEAHSDLGSSEKPSTPTSVIAARAPVIDGTPYAWGVTLADGTLTADPGAWDGTPEITYTYQWQRCDDEGEDCIDITGATAGEYVLTGADVDNRVRVVVTATNAGGNASSASDPTEVVGAATPPILEGGSAPSISGDPHDGQPQTADPGWWSGVDPITFIYQWRRCDASGDDCADISGATSEEYHATSSDLGATLRVHVRATNPSGSSTSVSDASPVITTAVPANIWQPSVSGEWSVGGELTVDDPGGWSGSMPFTYTFQWQRCDAYDELCDDLDGETSDTYTVTADDVRHVVRVLVTATNAHGDATSASYRAVINPAQPVNTALPEIHGTMRAGAVLTATTGAWDNPPDRYRYSWEHCNAAGNSCFTLSGATSSTYATSMWDPGSTYRVTVTAANVDVWSPPTATSALTPPLASPSGPQNLTAPALSTTAPVIGEAVTVSPGTWEGTGDVNYSYYWYYCDDDEPTSCYRLWEASDDSWTPTYDYRDWRLRVEVAATDDEGSNSVSTAVSDPLVLGLAHNVTAPTLEGDAVISGTLTTNAGQWTGIETLDYAWARCDEEGESCVDIAGDDPSRELTADDLDHTLRARVTGSNSLGQESVTTAPSELVGHPTRPVAGSTPPSIWGDAVVGEQLSADDGTWTGNSGASSYRWLRCDTAGDPCMPIAGATEAGYRVSRADAGAALRVAVTHTNAAGATTVRSDATDAVPDPPAVANLMPPSIQNYPWEIPAYNANTFLDDRGLWAGVPDRLQEQWQRCDPLTADVLTGVMECTDIPGATGDHVRPGADDIGYFLRVRETAITAGEADQVAFSAAMSRQVAVDTHEAGATLTGRAAVGGTLTAHSGVTNDADLPMSTTYKFYRQDGGSPTLVQDGSDATYEPTEDDLGYGISVEMTVTTLRADSAAPVAPDVVVNAGVDEIQTALTNGGVPSISGDLIVGQTLSVDPGWWSGGGGDVLYTYQWQRCDDEGEACVDIDDAVGEQYVAVLDDVDHTIRASVTAHVDAGGPSGEEDSEPVITDPVGPVIVADLPVNLELPTISGTAEAGQELSANPGDWTGSDPITYAYTWRSCDPVDTDSCIDVDNGAQETFRPTAEEIDRVLRVEVTATNGMGSAVATSAMTGEAVSAGPAPESVEAPSLTLLGPSGPGSTLVTDGGSWTNVEGGEIVGDPDHANLSYSWSRCDWAGANCQVIENADDPSYDLTEDDVDHRLRVTASVLTHGGSAAAASEPTDAMGDSAASAEGDIAYVDTTGELQLTPEDAEDGGDSTGLIDCEGLTGAPWCGMGQPRISPNLKLIAVSVETNDEAPGEGEIYVVNVDGTGARRVADGSDPAWSVDGTRILFTQATGDTTRAVSVSADGLHADDPQPLLPSGDAQVAPDQSSDGALVFASGNDSHGVNGLYLAVDGDQQAHRLGLGADFYQVTRPRFTDDEQAVTFSARLKSEGQGNRSLWQINRDGSDLQRLSPDDGNDYGPGTAGTDETITTQGYGECLIAFAPGRSAFAANDYVPPYIPPGCNGWHVYPGSVVIVHHDGRPPTTLHTTTPAFAVDVPRHRKKSKTTRHRRFLKFIKAYQPIVHGDPDDGFLPMPFPAVMKYRGIAGRRTCNVPNAVLPDSFGSCSIARLGDLDKDAPTGSYLDYPADFQIANQQRLSDASGHGYPRGLNRALVYFHVARNPQHTAFVVQYWFFYSYNYWYVTEDLGLKTLKGYADLHEGDWEHVDVLFKAKSIDEAMGKAPAKVLYSAHAKASRLRDWNSKDRRDGSNDGQGQPLHVRTYAAHGSHANLPRCGDDFASDARLKIPLAVSPVNGHIEYTNKTINDHVCPASEVRNAYTIQPSAGIDNLDTHPWACWRGGAGAASNNGEPPHDHPLINAVYKKSGTAFQPLSGVQQASASAADGMIYGVTSSGCPSTAVGSSFARSAFAAPSSKPAAAANAAQQTLETAAAEDAPFDEFSSCDAYGRPNDGPGVTVAVCDPDALRDSIDEGDSTPTVVWDGTSGDIQSRQPLLVTDATDGVPIVFHPQRDSNVLRIYVARTGADGTVQEGWFDGIEAPKGDPLTVDMSGAVWTVTDKTGRVVARYRGGAPVVHKRRAHRALRLLKLRREGKRLRAQFSFTASRRHARVLIEVRRGRRWAVIATRHVPLGRSVGSVRFTPPRAARTARIVLHAGRRVEASHPFRLASR